MTTVLRFASSDAPAGWLAQARTLCQRSFGPRFTADDWAHGLGGDHLVVLEGPRVVSHASVVARLLLVGDRSIRAGYVEAVATAPAAQGRRLGSAVMGAVAQVLAETYEMGALSTDRHAFYGRLGWERWAGPSYVVTGTDRIRTPDEDDGIMVLRFGRSSDVDPTRPIACEARAGDDW